MSDTERLADAGVKLAKLLRDAYWATAPIDVAKAANEVLTIEAERNIPKWEMKWIFPRRS
jgi:hypothetical protein